MKQIIDRITTQYVTLENAKDDCKNEIEDIFESMENPPLKEEKAALQKVAKAKALDKLDKLKSDADYLATAMGSLD